MEIEMYVGAIILLLICIINFIMILKNNKKLKNMDDTYWRKFNSFEHQLLNINKEITEDIKGDISLDIVVLQSNINALEDKLSKTITIKKSPKKK